VVTALGAAQVGVPGIVGEAGLAAEETLVLAQQRVVVVDLEAGFAGVAREVDLPGAGRLGELLVLHGRAEDHAQVVGRGGHARTVQTGWRGGAGVQRAQLLGQRVHLVDRNRYPAERAGQRVRGVVAGVHDQGEQQLVDRVLAAGTQTHPGALLVGVLLRADHDHVLAQLADHDDCQQHLDQRGRALAGMRVLRGQHRARVQVGDDPGGGVDVGRRLVGAGRVDQPALAHPGAADRARRDGQGLRPRATRRRLLGGVHRGRRDRAVGAGGLGGLRRRGRLAAGRDLARASRG
jgi:hypothetical protein